MSRSSLRRRAGAATACSLALVGSVLPVTVGTAHAVPGAASAVFINELHYDNAGTDVGELVEVAGPAGTDLTGWSVVLYNGGNGAEYDREVLSGVLPHVTGTGFGFATVSRPSNGLQNGAPDGVALLDASGAVVQFLSYEGAFTTAAGASTDIGVTQSGSDAVGSSLQLTGTGGTSGDFRWASSAAATPGEANVDQLLVAPADPLLPTVDCEPGLAATAGRAATSPVSGDGASAACSVTVTVTEPLGTTLVSTVQGPGPASPLDGQDVQVEAVVTSLLTSRDVLAGFSVQEEDADADASPVTSEGISVSCGTACPTGLAAGDLVQVVGTVGEPFGSTRIDATGGTVTVLASGQPLPSAAVVTLPASGSTGDPATFETVEGMVTTIPTTLAVSEHFALARFGQVVLTADEREHQYTQTSTPSVAGYEAFLADLATRRIVLDDDNDDQNDATSGPLRDEPYPYPTPGLSTGNAFRGGDTITGLTGVLEHSFGAWRLRPVPGVEYVFQPENPRPAAPDEVGGRLRIAGANVLNSFATIDTTSSDGTGPCGPAGTADCRGADSPEERQRQLAKTVAALATVDADVLGLVEVENDEGLATRQLVDALNAATAPGTYASVDTGVVGTDAIRQALLYTPSTVTPVGDVDLLTEQDDPRFDDDRNRPAVIQTFEEVATGERFTVAVNHLKSKGSRCGAGDDSRADGSGNCDLTRTRAAAALADHLATDPTGSGDPDVLVIGDLNSYSMERPITTLETAGYVDLLERFEGLESYGYVFDGLLGHLDHALATPSLAEQVTGAGGWRINADEVPLLGYDDTVRDAGESAFERTSAARPLYEADPYRSSDHDPVVVGLSLDTAPVADAGGPYTVRPGGRVVLDASGSSDLEGDELTHAWDLDGNGRFDDATGPTAVFRARRPGSRTVAVRVSDGRRSSVDEAVVEVVPPGRRR